MGRTGKLVLVGGDENKARGNWTRRIEFLLACLGYSVGLGNVLRFPYMCMKHGGGAFLIPYFLFMFLCGIPLFFLEFSIGQFSSLSPPAVWKLCPLFKGIGYTSIIVCFLGTTYYNMTLAWILYYLGHSFTKDLPWDKCDNSWNSLNCTVRDRKYSPANQTSADDIFTYGGTAGSYSSDYSSINLTNSVNATSRENLPSEEFWQLQVLRLSSGIDHMGGMRWQLVLCIGVAWLLIFICICNGVKSAGKAVYITVPLPYILLTTLLIRGCLLPGAVDGINSYLVPDIDKLLQFDVWVEACLQVFFSLGPAWGGLITLASYNRFNRNCFIPAFTIPVISCVTSFFAGFVIFSITGFLVKDTGLSVKEIMASGPDLAFKIFPEALAKIPIPPVWAVLFFLTLLTLELDTQFSLVETIASGICDAFTDKPGYKKTIVSAALCIAQFGIGLVFTTQGGMYVFHLFKVYCGWLVLLLIGIMECVVVGYLYGTNRFCYDVEMMIGKKSKVWWIWWKLCWWVITPGLLTVMFVMSCFKYKTPSYESDVYPVWAMALGWVIALGPLLPIPLVMVIEIARARGNVCRRIRYLLVPERDWGPALQHHRVNYAYGRDSSYKPVSLHCQEGKYMTEHSPL